MVFLAILQRPVSTQRLATTLRVSRSTVARAVATLRKKGFRVVGIRENGGWHYEIRNAREIAQAKWKSSRLRSMAGFASGSRPSPLKTEDQALYMGSLK
jgi:biotin operon repressor